MYWHHQKKKKNRKYMKFYNKILLTSALRTHVKITKNTIMSVTDNFYNKKIHLL